MANPDQPDTGPQGRQGPGARAGLKECAGAPAGGWVARSAGKSARSVLDKGFAGAAAVRNQWHWQVGLGVVTCAACTHEVASSRLVSGRTVMGCGVITSLILERDAPGNKQNS